MSSNWKYRGVAVYETLRNYLDYWEFVAKKYRLESEDECSFKEIFRNPLEGQEAKFIQALDLDAERKPHLLLKSLNKTTEFLVDSTKLRVVTGAFGANQETPAAVLAVEGIIGIVVFRARFFFEKCKLEIAQTVYLDGVLELENAFDITNTHRLDDQLLQQFGEVEGWTREVISRHVDDLKRVQEQWNSTISEFLSGELDDEPSEGSVIPGAIRRRVGELNQQADKPGSDRPLQDLIPAMNAILDREAIYFRACTNFTPTDVFPSLDIESRAIIRHDQQLARLIYKEEMLQLFLADWREDEEGRLIAVYARIAISLQEAKGYYEELDAYPPPRNLNGQWGEEFGSGWKLSLKRWQVGLEDNAISAQWRSISDREQISIKLTSPSLSVVGSIDGEEEFSTRFALTNHFCLVPRGFKEFALPPDPSKDPSFYETIFRRNADRFCEWLLDQNLLSPEAGKIYLQQCQMGGLWDTSNPLLIPKVTRKLDVEKNEFFDKAENVAIHWEWTGSTGLSKLAANLSGVVEIHGRQWVDERYRYLTLENGVRVGFSPVRRGALIELPTRFSGRSYEARKAQQTENRFRAFRMKADCLFDLDSSTPVSQKTLHDWAMANLVAYL